MENQSDKHRIAYHVIDMSDFARRFAIRPNGLMWFLGAGASASAGIPTAWDMILEFKKLLYASQPGVNPASVDNLSDRKVMSRLQDYVDSLAVFPPYGAPDEYAALFEATYKSEKDRRAYIDEKLKTSKPSYGHIALAALAKAKHTSIIWTTNFDTLIADACAKVYDSTKFLMSVSLDSPNLIQDIFNEQRWPVEVKLHGDFRSSRLKNTTDELKNQDTVFREKLIDACSRYGLIIIGYSGRDESVMNALAEGLEATSPYPRGLFWLHRVGNRPLPIVEAFLSKAAEKGVDGGLVEIDSFDETLRNLVKLCPNIDNACLDQFASERRIWSPAPLNSKNERFPAIRLNALELLNIPTLCRKIECNIGGHTEIIKAIDSANVQVLAARKQSGVIAFGNDHDIKKVFSNYNIRSLDLHTIESSRLSYDSQERGLLRQALSHALARRYDLYLIPKRNGDLLFPNNCNAANWQPLKALVGQLQGIVANGQGLTWHEGIRIKLDWANGQLWLLFEPQTVFTGQNDENKLLAAETANRRSARRYNKLLNSLLEFWACLLSANGSDLCALGVTNGVDAVFKLEPTLAISKRGQ